MKIGMPQLFEYDNLEDNFILAKALDLDFIELNLNFASLREEMERKNLQNLINKYKMEATLHFYDEADFGSYDEVAKAYLKLLKRYIKLGSSYIKQINIHLIPGPVVTISGIKNYVYEKEYNLYINRLINNLNKVKKICDKYNINLVIENTDNTPLYQKKVYIDLKNNGFNFCYDVGHDHLSNYVLFALTKELDLSYKEFHIHDFLDNKCHLALGEGIFDFNKYKDIIMKNDNYIVLEVKNKEDLEKSVPIFKNYIK